MDNLVIGSFNIIFTPFMFIGWAIIPLTICTIFKKIEKIVKNPEILETMRNNLNKTVVEKYHIDTVTKQRYELYKKLITE